MEDSAPRLGELRIRDDLLSLAEYYNSRGTSNSNNKEAIHNLYDLYINDFRKHERLFMELVDAAATGIAVDNLFFADQIGLVVADGQFPTILVF